MDRRHPSPVHFKPAGTIEFRIGADVLEDRRLAAPLEEVPGDLVGPVEPQGKGQRQPRADAAQVRIPGTEKEMVMVVHQHERVNRHREAPGEFGKTAEEAEAIVVRAEDAFAAIAAVEDTAPAMGHPDAKRSSHGSVNPTRRILSIV